MYGLLIYLSELELDYWITDVFKSQVKIQSCPVGFWLLAG